MGTESVEREFEGLGESDQVGAKTALGHGTRLFAQRCGRPSGITQTVKRGYTQSRPPRHSGHKSIRIEEPIRFAEMRGIQKFRRGRMKMLCPLQSLIGRTMQVGELLPPSLFFRKDFIL